MAEARGRFGVLLSGVLALLLAAVDADSLVASERQLLQIGTGYGGAGETTIIFSADVLVVGIALADVEGGVGDDMCSAALKAFQAAAPAGLSAPTACSTSAEYVSSRRRALLEDTGMSGVDVQVDLTVNSMEFTEEVLESMKVAFYLCFDSLLQEHMKDWPFAPWLIKEYGYVTTESITFTIMEDNGTITTVLTEFDAMGMTTTTIVTEAGGRTFTATTKAPNTITPEIYGYGHGYGYPGTYGYSYGYGHPGTYGYSYGYGHPGTYGYGYGYGYPGTYGHSYGYGYPGTYGYGYGYGYAAGGTPAKGSVVPAVCVI